MLTDLTPPSQDSIWQTGIKWKIQQSAAYRRPISLTGTMRWLRVKGWKKIYQDNGPPKKAGVVILISEKVDFKFTLSKQDKGHSILIKGEIQQKEITVINLYAPNVTTPSFIKHTLKDLKAYIDSDRVAMGDFNITLSPTDRSSKQKINKEILKLNHTIDQMDLADVYRIFHTTSAQYTFFSAAHGTLSKIDHILWHKASLKNIRK
jgi:exonuclease III